jgi:D-alanyl-D-alanine carboxypeptidase/D-alanyl-D-alanine-endopeptidase (penicillin-binding protein 4)
MYFKKTGIIALLGLFLTACSQPPAVDQPTKPNKTTPLDKSTSVDKTTQPEVKIPQKRVLLPAKFTDLPTEIASAMAASRLDTAGLSVYIQAVSSPAPLLTFNEDVPRNPASVMKLVTTYAGLGTLGADYRWPVELYTNGTVNGDTLQGDLFLKGYGSPNFKEGDLHHLLDDLRATGIKNISGNLVIDNTYFSIVKHDTGEFDGKRYAAYNAQSDALIYNEGVSEFVVRGSDVILPNPARNVQVDNKLQIKNVGCNGRYAYPRTGIKHNNDEVIIHFEGTVSSRCGERRYAFVITDPANMLHSTLSKIWTEEMAGVIAGHDFIIAPTPADAKLLAKIESEPVSDVLAMINKKSNNVMAQQLFLSIGAKQAGNGDTSLKAYQGIQQWFKSRGLDFPELVMENGSGLSRNGQISARHIAELLMDAYEHPQHDAFINSLPIMGVDGTLKKRMKGSHVAGHAHLKTGTLNNAKALAGYVSADDGETYIVAILHNDPEVKYKARPIHDLLIDWTARQQGKAFTPENGTNPESK